MDRKRFLTTGTAGLGAMALGCRSGSIEPAAESSLTRLRARPGEPGALLPAGTHDLFSATNVTGQLFVPPGDGALPLMLMLHGAGASRDVMHRVFPVAEANGVITATPQSLYRTWDLVLGQPGADVLRIDAVLRHAFGRCAVDPARILLAGFSDGGSYALSLGLRNGDLFTHIGAFAPGFMLPEPRVGKPRVFISHGTSDEILPAEQTSVPIREQLLQWAYDVAYRTFDGGHGINLTHVDEALKWLRS